MKQNRSESRARVSPPGVVREPLSGDVPRKLSLSERRALKARQVSLFEPVADVDADGRKLRG